MKIVERAESRGEERAVEFSAECGVDSKRGRCLVLHSSHAQLVQPPFAITGLRLQSQTHTTLTVQWDAADAHGGNGIPIKSYELQWRSHGEPRWKTAAAGIFGRVW